MSLACYVTVSARDPFLGAAMRMLRQGEMEGVPYVKDPHTGKIFHNLALSHFHLSRLNELFGKLELHRRPERLVATVTFCVH
jgi:hypothetical protein